MLFGISKLILAADCERNYIQIRVEFKNNNSQVFTILHSNILKIE